MKVSYREGLASRSGPESYAACGNALGVAAAGVHAGQRWGSEITHLMRRPCSPCAKMKEARLQQRDAQP